MAQIPAHLALGYIASEMLEFVTVQSRLLNMDATDLMIIACVAALSTRDALKDPNSIPEYQGGTQALPLKYCTGVATKEVSYALNKSRETTRRRLESLVKTGHLIRENRVYFMAYQGGEADFTSSARNTAVGTIKRLHDAYEAHLR
jgi:hypothetical protein